MEVRGNLMVVFCHEKQEGRRGGSGLTHARVTGCTKSGGIMAPTVGQTRVPLAEMGQAFYLLLLTVTSIYSTKLVISAFPFFPTICLRNTAFWREGH